MATSVMIDADTIRDFSDAQLSDWLEERDIPLEFCHVFERNCIDGVEFLLLKDEEVKKMVPPLGIAKKIIRLIPRLEDSTSNSEVTVSSPSNLSPPPTVTVSPSSAPSISPQDSVSASGSGSLRGMPNTSSELIIIPDTWRADTQTCIDAKLLAGDSRNVRNDIARTLATLLAAKVGNNPSTQQIEQVSRSLILKYPFMKDDLGSGYKSWVERIVTCLRNRVKQAKRNLRSKGMLADEDGTAPKRQRKSGNNDHLFRRYPAQGGGGGSLDDPRSIEEHCKGMREELKKASPRDHVLLPLLKSTYEDRRAYIEFDSEADVRSILEAYPALHRPAAIEQDMSLLMNAYVQDPKATFQKQWTTVFVPGILCYGEKTKKKGIGTILSEINKLDDTSRQATALKVLVEVLTNTKKLTSALSLIYEEREPTTTPEEVAKENPPRNSPRFVAFVGERQTQYYVLVEQKILCQVPSFQDALFVTFSSYYVFHLGYPTAIENVYFFLQDYVLAYPDSCRRKGTYLATASDIKKMCPNS